MDSLYKYLAECLIPVSIIQEAPSDARGFVLGINTPLRLRPADPGIMAYREPRS